MAKITTINPSPRSTAIEKTGGAEKKTTDPEEETALTAVRTAETTTGTAKEAATPAATGAEEVTSSETAAKEATDVETADAGTSAAADGAAAVGTARVSAATDGAAAVGTAGVGAAADGAAAGAASTAGAGPGRRRVTARASIARLVRKRRIRCPSPGRAAGCATAITVVNLLAVPGQPAGRTRRVTRKKEPGKDRPKTPATQARPESDAVAPPLPPALPRASSPNLP
ncbi:hypothetical protein Aco03nite_019010 [Actinoplanes couchii]|uniref:Uncharacterized protein n=1 Tax=Actinoplanes couchii TaxID=403638 RepID=A0ABQ3X4Q2_9ACTN|nr:hypothetical protein Aco03nite_019010 [Actinoplanes couchii]